MLQELLIDLRGGANDEGVIRGNDLRQLLGAETELLIGLDLLSKTRDPGGG